MTTPHPDSPARITPAERSAAALELAATAQIRIAAALERIAAAMPEPEPPVDAPTIGDFAWLPARSGKGWVADYPDHTDSSGQPIRLYVHITDEDRVGAVAFAGDDLIPGVSWHNADTSDRAVAALLETLERRFAKPEPQQQRGRVGSAMDALSRRRRKPNP